ncbi:MAG: hypothetical protein ACRCYP_04545 [Alphaproteobacteria bacterium]
MVHLKNISRQHRRENWKAVLRIAAFAICLVGIYASVLFYYFEKKLRLTHTNALKSVELSVNKYIHDIQSDLQHLGWRLERLSGISPSLLQEFMMQKRKSSIQVLWIPPGGKVLYFGPFTEEPLLIEKSSQPISPNTSMHLEKVKGLLVFYHTVKHPNNLFRGKLALSVPLKTLPTSVFFVATDLVTKRTLENYRGSYIIPIQKSNHAIILKSNTDTLHLYWQEHRLSLLIFAIFSLGSAVFFLIYGRQAYQKALFFLKEAIDITNQKNYELVNALSVEQLENKKLTKKVSLLEHASKHRETLICDILKRQRLMREKAYLHIAIFSEETHFLEDEAENVKLWIQDMRNHFGPPHVEPFHFKSAFEQTLAVFAAEMEHHQIRWCVEDQIHGDLIESDRLILSVILANLLNQSLMRLPKDGILHMILSRKKNGFKIQILDNGYIIQGMDFFTKISQTKFFFLEQDVFKKVCDSLQLKITIKNKIQERAGEMNLTLLEVPLKLKFSNTEVQEEKIYLPANVIRFPNKKGRHPHLSDPI